jgi:DNA end-binding protein Ku
MEVRHFVPRAGIDWIHFEDGYFVAPSRKGLHAYRLLHEVLVRTDRAAIGSLVLRQKQHLAAVLPGADGMLITAIMRFFDELREPDFVVPAGPVPPSEIEMARQIVEAMSVEWRPEEYGDTYHRALRKLLERKVSGELEESGVALERSLPPDRPVAEALRATLTDLPRKALAASPAKKRRPPRKGERTA